MTIDERGDLQNLAGTNARQHVFGRQPLAEGPYGFSSAISRARPPREAGRAEGTGGAAGWGMERSATRADAASAEEPSTSDRRDTLSDVAAPSVGCLLGPLMLVGYSGRLYMDNNNVVP